MKIGDTFQIIRDHTCRPYKAHVIAIVDETMIVFKWFGRRKQWWHYEVQQESVIESEIERAEKLVSWKKQQ